MITANETPEELTIEFENLIKLLDDEDENIYGSIKERFISHGNPSSEFLRNYSGSENILVKKRASEIISIINFEDTEQKFLRLIERDDPDILEEAVFLIAAMNYPGISINEYGSQLDLIAKEIDQLLKSSDIPDNINILDTLNIINEYLFQGFQLLKITFARQSNSPCYLQLHLLEKSHVHVKDVKKYQKNARHEKTVQPPLARVRYQFVEHTYVIYS